MLLIEDVEDLGHKGNIVKVKPGYFRNYLGPKKLAVLANKSALRMQSKLQEQREKQAEVDKKESLYFANKIKDKSFAIEVKVDGDGHMYGSVSVLDIVKLLKDKNYVIGKKNILLPHPIKKTGTYKIDLKLKEGITASFDIKIIPEGYLEPNYKRVKGSNKA